VSGGTATSGDAASAASFAFGASLPHASASGVSATPTRAVTESVRASMASS